MADDSEGDAPGDAVGDDADGDGPAVTLVFDDGRTETVRAAPGESVVEAAERAGVGVPYGCLTGACGTCTGRLVAARTTGVDPGGVGGRGDDVADGDGRSGDGAGDGATGDAIDHRRPPRALKDRHLAGGYVLCCVGVPRPDCRLRIGPDVAAELVSNRSDFR